MIVLFDIQDRIEEKINYIMMEYDDNPSSDLLVEIEERKDAYFFSCYCIEAKYGEPSPLKLEDNLQEEAHTSPPSHDPLLHNI
jgi:hypothetical protein